MFDLQDQASVRFKRKESPIPHHEAGSGKERAQGTHPLDSEASMELYYRLLDGYTRELDRQEDNRAKQAADEDFYDNYQWSEEDAQELKDRGQVPLVYNVIATTVNWVIGTEKRGRADFKILPRRKEHGKPAEKKTQLLKYLSDVNRTPFHRSRAFADTVKVGIGWLEDAVGDGDDGGEPLYTRYENWRYMLWDSTATELDLEDARYIYRVKWVDLDVAQALAPDRKGLLEQAARDGEIFTMSGDYGDDPMDFPEYDAETAGSISRMPNRYVRRRVRIVEAWFKVPKKVKRMSGGQFAGEIFDPHSPGHQQEVISGEAEIIEKTTMQVHVALFTTGQGGGLLHVSPTPYRHNRYPFTPIWGNRRGRTGLPYGMISGLRGIQEDINKRASKALYILSSNKTIVDEGAVEDLDELAEEVARPDAFIVKKSGKELVLNAERDLADAHLQIMDRDIMLVQSVGGVTDENLGRQTNAKSGIAIERRQDQGALTTAHYFDNMRFAMQVQGEKQLSHVEQFMSDRKQFRITNMRGKPEFVDVNDGLPENDIVRSKADFVIDEADWRASMRQAAAEQLLEAMQKLPPEVALVFLDLVVENMDLPNREEIVRRVREITGQGDPDADETDEEEVARRQAAQEKAARQRALEDATLGKLIAEGAEKRAKARETEAKTARVNLDSMGGSSRGALDIAYDLLMAKGLAPVADQLMRDAGVVTRTELEETAAAANQAQPPAAPQSAPQDQQLATEGVE